jgi:hypothetical protein
LHKHLHNELHIYKCDPRDKQHIQGT